MTIIRLRRGVSADWTTADPVLDEGEPGWDNVAQVLKIGNGFTVWSALDPVVTEPGFRAVVGSTPPTVTMQDGFPVIWVQDNSVLSPVPVTPTAPSFNYSTFAVTVPSLVGVQYQFQDPVWLTWTPLATGTTSLSAFTRPFTAKVRAVATPGYVLTSAYQWDALFYTAGSLALFASDGFSGAAAQMCTVTGPGRVFDMAGGGSASGGSIPAWTSPAGASGLGVDGAGHATLTVPANNGIIYIPIGADNCAIEVDIFDYDVAHARNLRLGFGAANSNSIPNTMATATISISSTTANMVLGDGGVGSDQTFLYKTSVTEAQLLGTWRFVWVNKAIQVVAPDGQVYNKDFSASANAFGQYIYYRPMGSAPYTSADAVRVYR
jgi:hypothetical protein